MKRVFLIILALIFVFSTISLTSCSEFFEALASAIEEFEETYDIETNEETKQVETQTEKENGPPFVMEPELVDYVLNKEEFIDDLEREASNIIDDAIEIACKYVLTMKDDRHSYVSYSFDSDPDGYYAALLDEEKDLFDKMVDAGYKRKTFSINEENYSGDLNKAYFSLRKPLEFNEPIISSCCYMYAITYGDMNYVTHTKQLQLKYFDPYKDETYPINDTTGMEKLKHDMALFERIIKRIVRYMPTGLTTYDKYYYLATVLTEHVMYDDRTSNCFTAFGALVCGRAVCEGYASAYYLLCKEADLYCSYRTGRPNEGSAHIWNMVKLESGLYNVDVTWCAEAIPSKRGWFNNFMKTDEEFESHNPTTGQKSTKVYEPGPYDR